MLDNLYHEINFKGIFFFDNEITDYSNFLSNK